VPSDWSRQVDTSLDGLVGSAVESASAHACSLCEERFRTMVRGIHIYHIYIQCNVLFVLCMHACACFRLHVRVFF
jgi:hypothetical protein